jgi:ABC-type transporter Mla MlaB component
MMSTTRSRASRLPAEPILSVSLDGDGGTCVLSLAGQLDSGSAIGLQTQFDQLQSMSFDGVVIDAERLTSVDAVGASLLRNLCRYVSAKGQAVWIKMRGQTVGDGSLGAAELRLERLCQQGSRRRPALSSTALLTTRTL